MTTLTRAHASSSSAQSVDQLTTHRGRRSRGTGNSRPHRPRLDEHSAPCLSQPLRQCIPKRDGFPTETAAKNALIVHTVRSIQARHSRGSVYTRRASLRTLPRRRSQLNSAHATIVSRWSFSLTKYVAKSRQRKLYTNLARHAWHIPLVLHERRLRTGGDHRLTRSEGIRDIWEKRWSASSLTMRVWGC